MYTPDENELTVLSIGAPASVHNWRQRRLDLMQEHIRLGGPFNIG